MFSKLMSQASQFAMEGVKNLVVKKHVSCYISHQIFRDYIVVYFATLFRPSLV